MFLSQTRYACLPLAGCSRCSFSASANHGAAQVAIEARQGGVLCEHTQTKWERSSRETCLFVRGEIETGRDEEREKENACEKLRKFHLAGKQEGKGVEVRRGE